MGSWIPSDVGQMLSAQQGRKEQKPFLPRQQGYHSVDDEVGSEESNRNERANEPYYTTRKEKI
jgi:hypothetical protein